MFDAGAIPDSHFKADGAPVTEGIMSASKPLKPQLAAAGYSPADVTYLAMSHYHSDHTANANDFAGATWIVQKAERDFMFADKPQGIIQPAHYSALRNAKTRILNNEDLDVFGDGSVVVIVDAGSYARPSGPLREAREDGARGAGRRPLSLPRGAHDRQDPDLRVQRRAVQGVAREGRSVHEAEQGRALDRARHRHAREAAEGAGVRGVSSDRRSPRRFRFVGGSATVLATRRVATIRLERRSVAPRKLRQCVCIEVIDASPDTFKPTVMIVGHDPSRVADTATLRNEGGFGRTVF